MMYLVLLVTVALISTTCTVDVLYLRGVPRLNNPSYWDYYFSCNAVGTTLQWDVNNNTLGGFLGGNVAQILNGTTSNFSYIATLLSSKVTLERQFTFDSVLIVSLQGIFNLNVVCRNGSSSDSTVSMDNGLGVEEKINSTSVFLEYLLTQNIVGADDSRHTSIFICGVENQFMTWRINGVADAEFSFTAFDVIGQEWRSLQENDTAVKQQAIFISREPYRLVTALFVIDTSEVTVTCGYTQNEVQLTSKSENPTVPEASTSEASSGGTMDTTQDSSPLYITIGVISGFVVVVAVPIMVIVSCLVLWRIAYKKGKNKENMDIKSDAEPQEHRYGLSSHPKQHHHLSRKSSSSARLFSYETKDEDAKAKSNSEHHKYQDKDIVEVPHQSSSPLQYDSELGFHYHDIKFYCKECGKFVMEPSSSLSYIKNRTQPNLCSVCLYRTCLPHQQDIGEYLSDMAATDGMTFTKDSQPTLKQLKLLEIGEEKIKIMESVCPQWKSIGTLMDFDDLGSKISLIEEETSNLEDHLIRVLRLWLNGESRNYKPASWRTLLLLLKESGYSALAEKLNRHFK